MKKFTTSKRNRKKERNDCLMEEKTEEVKSTKKPREVINGFLRLYILY